MMMMMRRRRSKKKNRVRMRRMRRMLAEKRMRGRNTCTFVKRNPKPRRCNLRYIAIILALKDAAPM
jgi:hypothetical protein